jgi:hypothetical protein
LATIDLLRERDATPTTRLVPTRGLVVAAIAVGLGACLVRPSGGSLPAGDLAILAMMAATAILGAIEARRLVRARTLDAENPSGTWHTVIVGTQGPAETSIRRSSPKSPPRRDPERRTLARRANVKQTAVTEPRRGVTLARSHGSE